MSAIGIPFVWLYVKTEETNFTKARPVSITGESLRSFTEEVMMDDGKVAVSGSPSANYAVTKCKLVIFDPTWTYWETLLLINKNLDYEYGWMGDDGTVISTSGKIRATIQELYPKFTFQGSDVEVTLVGSPSANAQQGSSFNYAVWTLSRTFVPADKFEGIVKGTYYNSKFPVVNFASPAQRAELEKATKKWKEDIYRLDKGRSFPSGPYVDPNRPLTPLPNRPSLSGVALDEEDARAKYGDRETLPADAAPYRSISDLVVRLAAAIGMKAEVDETVPARHNVRMNNQTVENFIRETLVPAAITKDGKSNFRAWIRGDTIFFKSQSSATESGSVKRVYRYGGNNSSMQEQAPFEKGGMGTLLEFETRIQPNFLINSAASNLVAVSIDPVLKLNVGENVVSAGASVGENAVLLGEIQQDLTQEFLSTAKALRTSTPTALFHLQPKTAPTEDLNSDWMLWDESQRIAKNVVEGLSGPFDVNIEEVRPGQLPSSGTGPATPAEKQILINKIQPAAYAKLQAARRQQQKDVAARGGTLGWADTTALQEVTKPGAPQDRTQAGRLYVLPYADARIQEIASYINTASFIGRVFSATGITYGDPDLRLFNRVQIDLVTSSGSLHYASGIYIITGINHKIDGGGFTTEITLATAGINSKSTAGLSGTAEQNSSFSKPPADQSKQGIEIKAEPQ